MIHRLSTYKTKQKKVGSYMMAIGNWYFKQNSPIRSLPLKYFTNKLATINKHCFSIVDEHLTSKLCHQCNQPLSFYDKKKQDMVQMVVGVKAPFSKIFYCQYCNVVLDRDVNGSINIGEILKYQIQNNGARPVAFQKHQGKLSITFNLYR